MMVFLTYVDDLLFCFVELDFMTLWFFPLVALAFLVTVPRIVRSLFEWR